ncbi:tRNA nucleotidyltransferase/poly(A) polymerase [Phaffia rhodozyma]|uniref:tRNA nucleotidyltransferase/poly(A) polymerase n=1 Tax=Phaffia rhodozyma TaxID=264483 RepID=A0A0F7SRI2_PHARH|nr:tRNA nucleotidyltransferase/poly(A) polymerase [Phaffia rhodozyma]
MRLPANTLPYIRTRPSPYIIRPHIKTFTSSVPSTFILPFDKANRKMINQNRKIELTPAEDKLCGLLEEFREFIAKTEPSGPQVECRIAGGWVRDKLLSLPCDDIDLALSNHTGHPFAIAFSSFLSNHHPEIPRTSVAKIESNPEQSKHLETAKQVIMGLDLDFVNLRNEEYTDGSRIPSEMKFGTPLDDALRRDITINSLFYNVHTRAVEDHTQMGLTDLEHGLIRTPIEAHKTFEDDPLRLIRCVRFASRYNFELTDDIREACKDDALKKGLRERISRERVGIEIEKMFGHKNALYAFSLIDSLDLYDSIFVLPPVLASTQTASPGPRSTALVAGYVLSHFLSSSPLPQPARLESGEELPVPAKALFAHINQDDIRKKLFLAACAAPWKNVRVKVKKTEQSAPEMLIKEAIKLSGAEAQFVSKLYQSERPIHAISTGDASDPRRRSTIGNVLRMPYVHDPSKSTTWDVSVFWSMLMELVPLYQIETNAFRQEAKEVVERFNRFTDDVVRLELPAAIESKPMMDGNAIQSSLGLPGGPMIKTILDKVVSWGFDHPTSSVEECEIWMKDEFAKGNFGIISESGGAVGKGKRKPKAA